jgi:hypothetical protein
MNVHRSLWLALPLAFLLPVGCNGAAETGQASEGVAAEAEAVPGAVAATPPGHAQNHWRHHPSAVRQMLHAASSLDLSDAQKASIDNLSSQLHAEHTAPPAEQVAMHTALVQGVRAGNVDLVKLAPLQAAASTAHQARAAREASVLNGLYAALEPAQRQALVSIVQERQAERAARHASRREEAEANGGFGQQRLAHLTSELGLDAAQQAQVQSLMANRPAPGAMSAQHEAMKERNAAMLTAFTGDGFDATKFEAPAPAAGEMGPAQHAQFLAKLVPILTAGQRETLATSMESHQQAPQ